jgi:hypothetical protein
MVPGASKASGPDAVSFLFRFCLPTARTCFFAVFPLFPHSFPTAPRLLGGPGNVESSPHYYGLTRRREAQKGPCRMSTYYPGIAKASLPRCG